MSEPHEFKPQPPKELPRMLRNPLDAADLGPIELIDRVLERIPEGDPLRFDLHRLRRKVQQEELTIVQAREALEKMDEVVKKVTAPANRIGTFLGLPRKDCAQVVVGGSDYFTNIDPRLDAEALKIGTRVLVNEAYVVIGDLGYDRNGPVGTVADVLPDGRVRVGQQHGLHSVIVNRSTDLRDETLKSGDELRIDPSFRVAIELLKSPQARDHFLDTVPVLPWEKVGGQSEAIQAIKDTIELPMLHGDLFKKFEHAQPKGILLYGPPGCGKTLIGKATAYNLTQQLKAKSGKDMKEYFLHIKGPEVLNMWVGESERIVREIFNTARQRAKEGYLPFIFIDEAESILGTRRASRYFNILSTLVPMFCAEMDGIESLNQMVIILASNRADLIDPAILRPGRIDRKVKVARPDKTAAREIFRIYLTSNLPLDPAALKAAGGDAKTATNKLVDTVVTKMYSCDDATRFLEVTLRSGRHETLHYGELASGAIIASIVERAKETAIKRAIASGKEEGVGEGDLLCALSAEFACHDVFPPTDIVEDWLKLLDYDPENVVKVSPIRAVEVGAERPSGVI